MTTQSIVLKPATTLDIKDGLGLLITALCGAVWITQTGDHNDVILSRGDSFTLNRDGLAVISALSGVTAAISVSSDSPTKSTEVIQDLTPAIGPLTPTRHAA